MNRSLIFVLLILLVAFSANSEDVNWNLYLNGAIFEDVTEESGFFHIGQGKGIAMEDFDLDGDLDLYVGAVFQDNKLYMNEVNLRFRDVTSIFRIGCRYDTFGSVWADFNNDGNLDLFVANGPEGSKKMGGDSFHPNTFYIGFDGGFYENAEAAGLSGTRFNCSCGVTTADVNGDGLLDIYVSEGAVSSGGREWANSLYVNKGDGTYNDIAQRAGVANEGTGFNCSFSDYDNDGDPDLYVGNLNETPDTLNFVLYRNNGDGTFTDVSKEAGIVVRGSNTSCFWGDIDNDGNQDLFLARRPMNKKWGENVLFRNNGDGTFTDISREAGVDVDTNTRGCTMGDIDNDGDLDIIVNNSLYYTLVFINDGKGKFIESHKTTGGSYYYGHGCVLGDLDNDGDLDFAGGNWRRPHLNNPGKWFLFNNKTNNKNFIKVNVKGTKSNRSAVMSKVWIYDAGKSKSKSALRGYREVAAGNNVFCSNPLVQHFGVDASKKHDIVVKFPSGIEKILKNVQPGKTYDIYETDVDPREYERVRR